MRRPTVPVLVVALVATIAPAFASTVHKCRRPDGGVAYRSVACDVGERLVAVWEVDPAPAPPAARTVRPTTRGRAPRPERSVPRGRQAAAATSVDACHAAKQRRDEVERRVGLARTYELLSALQREVYDACR